MKTHIDLRKIEIGPEYTFTKPHADRRDPVLEESLKPKRQKWDLRITAIWLALIVGTAALIWLLVKRPPLFFGGGFVASGAYYMTCASRAKGWRAIGNATFAIALIVLGVGIASK